MRASLSVPGWTGTLHLGEHHILAPETASVFQHWPVAVSTTTNRPCSRHRSPPDPGPRSLLGRLVPAPRLASRPLGFCSAYWAQRSNSGKRSSLEVRWAALGVSSTWRLGCL